MRDRRFPDCAGRKSSEKDRYEATKKICGMVYTCANRAKNNRR